MAFFAGERRTPDYTVAAGLSPTSAADEHTLARDLWPDGIGKLKQDKLVTISTLPAARVVPHDALALPDWICVEPQPYLSRALVSVQGTVEGAAPDVGLVVRVQGVIADMNLLVMGNWDL